MLDELSRHLGSLIDRGGPVILVLLVLSIVSLTLIFERGWFWIRASRRGRPDRLARLNTALRCGEHDLALGLVGDDRSPYGMVTRALIDHGPTDSVAIEVVEAERPRIDRFMVALSTIITAAPLIGILGTVVGIIQSFRLLDGQNTLMEPGDVAGGIATALLTTAMGLIVALMTLFPYQSFRGQSDRMMGRLESVIASAQQGGTASRAERVRRAPPASRPVTAPPPEEAS